jgi:integrase
MFNKAIDWGWNKPNPAYAVKRFKEVSRERFLSVQEMKRFLDALGNEPCEIVRDYLYMSLFTGARRSNVQAMRWQDIDTESMQWVIPVTKNGKPHIIPLVEQAIDILKCIRLKTNNEWVFPSAKSKSGHLENPMPIWNDVLKRAGIENLRIHDLRRTLRRRLKGVIFLISELHPKIQTSV